MKNWRSDRFQRPLTLLQRRIFVDEASAPAEFINSPDSVSIEWTLMICPLRENSDRTQPQR